MSSIGGTRERLGEGVQRGAQCRTGSRIKPWQQRFHFARKMPRLQLFGGQHVRRGWKGERAAAGAGHGDDEGVGDGKRIDTEGGKYLSERTVRLQPGLDALGPWCAGEWLAEAAAICQAPAFDFDRDDAVPGEQDRGARL